MPPSRSPAWRSCATAPTRTALPDSPGLSRPGRCTARRPRTHPTCWRLCTPSHWSEGGRVRGDAAVLNELLAKVPTREYDVGDAWVLGRIPGSSDSIQAGFLAASDTELKVRWLTLLTFSADSVSDPSAGAGLCGARQLRGPATVRRPRVRRAALDRNSPEPAGAARRSRPRQGGGRLRRPGPVPRRLRLPGQRQLGRHLADAASGSRSGSGSCRRVDRRSVQHDSRLGSNQHA